MIIIIYHNPTNKEKPFLYPKRKLDILSYVFDDLYEFAMNHYGALLNEFTNEYMTHYEYTTNLDVKGKINNLYTWWLIFSEHISIDQETIFEKFFRSNPSKIRRFPFLKVLFSRWQDLHPSFYLVEDRRDGIVFLDDLIEARSKTTIINEDLDYVHVGQIVTGFIFPIGNGVYTYFFDFLSFPKELIFPISNELNIMLNRNQNIRTHQLMKIYPSLLRRMIQLILEYRKSS